MNAVAAKRPPTFTTYTEVEVEVDIDPEYLEREGWVYVGKDKGPSTQSVLQVVEQWHNDSHDGPFRWCSHELCDAVRGRSYE